jgi:hypothetical protein
MSARPAPIDRSACPGSQHGTSNAYRNHGCRCADARRANTRYGKLRRAGLHQARWVSSLGVIRRRQALAAIGYGLRELEPYFGTSWRGVGNYQSRERVHRSTYDRWVEVYDRLSMTPGPNALVKQHARQQGWAPPLAWDDDELDNPEARPARMPRAWRTRPDEKRIAAALAGDEAARQALRSPDRREIVVRLHGEGLTDPAIMARSGIKQSTIRAIRTQLCLSSNHEPDVRRRAAG